MSPASRPVTEIARKALYRLSELGLPPTPENYARFYHEEAGGKETLAKPVVVADGPADDGDSLHGQERNAEMAAALSGVLEEISERTELFTEHVRHRNEAMRSHVSDLSVQEAPLPVMRTLQHILTTADAILQSSSETCDGLRLTRQNLDEIRRELAETRRLAMEDALTGVANRRALEQIMRRELAHSRRTGRPLSLAMLDLDHFKAVNDTWGHEVGDRALVHLVDVLRGGLRDSDLVARYGGEEFVLLFTETNLSGARFVTDRLRAMLARAPMRQNGVAIPLAFSAGIAGLRPEDNGHSLLARADALLYEAKRTGRDRVVTEPPEPVKTS